MLFFLLLLHSQDKNGLDKSRKEAMKKIVNPKYESLSAWLDKLADAEYFESHGEVLHQGRYVI